MAVNCLQGMLFQRLIFVHVIHRNYTNPVSILKFDNLRFTILKDLTRTLDLTTLLPTFLTCVLL